jgi:hypothetical protein
MMPLYLYLFIIFIIKKIKSLHIHTGIYQTMVETNIEAKAR